MRVTDDRLEDWPPALREMVAGGLHRQLVEPRSGSTWHFAEAQLDPFQPENGRLYRTLSLGIETAIVLLLRRQSDPQHLYELIGLRPPADGVGVAEYRPLDSGQHHTLIVRRACAYTQGSVVIGEIQWDGEHGGVDHLVNPLQARPGREREELAAAMDGLRVLSNITKHPGGRPSITDAEAFAEAVQCGRQWLSDNPGAAPRDFKRSHLAARLCVQPKSLDERMRARHFTLKMVRNQLA